jgi:hypothetical protein
MSRADSILGYGISILCLGGGAGLRVTSQASNGRIIPGALLRHHNQRLVQRKSLIEKGELSCDSEYCLQRS